MTQKRSSAKIVLSIVAALLIICTLGTATFAANQVANYKLAYGQAVPTDEKLSAKVSQYNFTGDEGILYFMQISKGKPNSFYAVEIFSDSGYTTKIRSFSKQFSTTAGNTPLKIKWEFKTTVSGKYYGRCYTYVETTKDGVTTKTVDSSSFSKFEININRMSSKTVKLKSLVNSATGPKITWEALPTGKQYKVYRHLSGEKWKASDLIATVTGTSYTDTKAVSGKDYTYTVKCSDGKYISKFDSKGLTIKYISMPKISVIGAGVNGNAVIKWDAVVGAKGYYVYRKGGSLSNYNWKLIATIKDNKTVSYVDKDATSTDWNYTYTVKAYNGKTVSAYNYNGVDFDYIKAPTLKKVSSYDGGMKIEWTNANENVIGHYVYRLNGSSWKYLGKTSQSYFIDKTAESGKKYTYTVKPFSDTNVGGYSSKGINGTFIKTPALLSLSFDGKYNANLKWEAISGAEGYVVYRKINNAKAWGNPIATVKGEKTTTFADTSTKTPGASYKYTVRAFDKNKVYSYFKESGIVCVHLTKPEFTVEQTETADNSLALTVSWSPVKGATRYNVYRHLAGEKWKSEDYVATVTGTTFVDTTVQNGVTYEYAVKAFNNNNDQSPFNTKTATAITIPVISKVFVVNNLQSQFARVTWGAVEGAESYNIYRKPKDGSEWEKLENTTETMFTDSSEGASTTAYHYAVSTVIGKLESAKSTPSGNFAEITLEASVTDDGIKLDWNCEKFSKATLTRATGSEPAIPIDGFTNGQFSYIDTSAEKGETYTYFINIIVGGKVNGVASATIRRPHDPLAQTVITSVSNATEGSLYGARITWLKVDFAEEYIVLKSSDDGFLNWTEIGTLTNEDAVNGEISFVDNTIAPNIEYAYKIKARAPIADRPESESEYKTITLLSPLDDLTNVTASVATGSDNQAVQLTWSPVKNAEGYKIYRTNSPDVEDSWVEVGAVELDGLEIREEDYVTTDNTITENGTYTYKIVAYSSDRGRVSNISDPVEITGFEDKNLEPDEPTEPEEPTNPDDNGGTTEPSEPDNGETTEPSEPDNGGTTEPSEPDNGGTTDPSEPNPDDDGPVMDELDS